MTSSALQRIPGLIYRGIKAVPHDAVGQPPRAVVTPSRLWANYRQPPFVGKAGSALSINIFMPLFSIYYFSMGANGWPLSQHGRNKITQTSFLIENRVEVPGSRSIQEIKLWALESSCRMTGSGDQESEQREA